MSSSARRGHKEAENGEIGVAVVNDEATVKRIWVSGRRVRLEADNPGVPPMEFDAASSNVRIVGKVIGVVRTMQ